jgi:hypothetical protein
LIRIRGQCPLRPRFKGGALGGLRGLPLREVEKVEKIEEPVVQVVAKVEKMEEEVVEVGAVKEVGLRAGALSGKLDKIFCGDNRVNNDGNSGA